MEILLIRKGFTPDATEGDLYIDNKLECHTLEDCVREVKVFGKTAIPCGRYRVVLDQSTRFHQVMPHILEVPGFEGVRIHWGNKPQDTEGCILVGSDQGKLTDAWIGNSKIAYQKLMAKLLDATAAHKEIWLTISEDHHKAAA